MLTTLARLSLIAAGGAALLRCQAPCNPGSFASYVPLTYAPTDVYLPITNSTVGYTLINAPSTNDRGDVAVTGIYQGNKVVHLFRDADQRSAAAVVGTLTAAVGVAAHPSNVLLASTAVVNANGDVASRRSDSALQLVRVHTNSSPYTLNNIVSCSATALFANNQFVFLSPFTGVADRVGAQTVPFVYYYGEQQASAASPLIKGIYASNLPIAALNPPPTVPPAPLAVTGGSSPFTDILGGYLATSEKGDVVFRATTASGTGIWMVPSTGGPAPVLAASPAVFSAIGDRPGVSSYADASGISGVPAFYGVTTTGQAGVFLKFPGENKPRFASSALPTATTGSVTGAVVGVQPTGFAPTSFARVGVNALNQVVFLAQDANGNTALFSNNLGRMRRILGVNDMVPIGGGNQVVTGIQIHDSITDRGDIVATVSHAGGQAIVRCLRAFMQAKGTLGSAPWSPTMPEQVAIAKPSYQDTGYLLRAVPNSGYAPGVTIGNVGCNLTSTANVVSAFGILAPPSLLQNWLLAKYASQACSARRFDYITKDNDFAESFVLQFTKEAVDAGFANGYVRYRGPHMRTASSTNMARIVAELRAGNPVKLRVPNRNKRYGHYVMVYGLRDPSKPDNQITPEDVLVHDPYQRRDSLQELQQIFAPTWGANWLEDSTYPRVHVYELRPAVMPEPNDLRIRVHSPVEVVVTDPLGRKLGFDPAIGAFAQIPNAMYWLDSSYDSIEDPVSGTSFPAWGTYEDRKTADLFDAVAGPYTMEIIGTGVGNYEINVSGSGALVATEPYFAGAITTGQRIMVSWRAEARTALRRLTPPVLGMPLDFELSSPAHPNDLYVQAAAFGTVPGIPLGTRVFPLNPDGLFDLSLNNPGVFNNFVGTLGAGGTAQTTLLLPPIPALAGLTIYSAFVTFNGATGFGGISDPLPITLQ